MNKKQKTQREPIISERKLKNTVKHGDIGETRGFVFKNRYAIAVIASLTVLFISILATVKTGFIAGLQSALFYSLKMPFEILRINGLKLVFPPYFLINLFFACLSAFVLITLFMKKTGAIKDLASVYKRAAFVVVIAIVHLCLMALFVSHSMFVLQLVLFTLELFLLGTFAAGRDKINKVETKTDVLEGSEVKALLALAAAVLLLNMFDWKSWKYSFIGDEWSFYDYAKGLLAGKRPLDFFSGEGVYGFNPVLSSIWQAFIMSFTGQGVFGWKLSSALIVPLTVIPFYSWNKMVFNRTVAVIATAVFVCSSAMLAFSHIGYNNLQVVFFYAASLMALELALRKNSAFWAFLAALVLGLGCYTYYLSRLMIIVAVFYWLFHPGRKAFSKFNLFLMLAVYGLIISLLPLEPGFLHNMANRSAVGTSEIANPAERPWYLLINFIHSLLFFVTKGKDSHFVTGGLTDIFTAAGVIAGFIWLFIAAVKDWRAKVLLVSYFLLVFFTGGLVQYHYPVNTRMQFLIPMLATIAGIGYSRVFGLASYFRDANKIKKLAVAACISVIAGLNFYNFYIYMPVNFQFTIQAHVIKYLQQNKNKDCVLVMSDISTMSETIALYGLDKKSKRASMEGLEEMLKAGALKGKSVVFDLWSLGLNEKISDFCKPGYVIRDYVSKKGILYVYDFTKDFRYYDAFVELWTTGLTAYVPENKPEKNWPAAGMPEVKTTKNGQAAGSGTFFLKEVKSNFSFEASYRPMRSNEIKGSVLTAVKLDSPLLAPSDAVVNAAGGVLYVADSGAWKILKFTRQPDLSYRLSTRFDPVKPGIFGIIKPTISDGSTGPLFLALDRVKNLLYSLDGRSGRITVFDSDGRLIKELASDRLLKDCASLAVSVSGDMLAAANPETNMFFIIGMDGKVINGYTTTNGIGMGQLNRPCYAGFDSDNNLYIADTLNGRVDKFDRNMNYVINYRVGLLSRSQYPRVAVFDKEVKKPYFAVTQPEMKKVFFYLFSEDAFRTASIEEAGGIKLVNPTALSADAANNLYILDTKVKMIVKLVIPKGAMDGYIQPAPRGK